MPVSSGEMRPSGETAVASAITIPAPPFANWARCVWCHSCGTPSTALYWHIGATQRRLRAVSPRIVKGENNAVIGAPVRIGCGGEMRQRGWGR